MTAKLRRKIRKTKPKNGQIRVEVPSVSVFDVRNGGTHMYGDLDVLGAVAREFPRHRVMMVRENGVKQFVLEKGPRLMM